MNFQKNAMMQAALQKQAMQGTPMQQGIPNQGVPSQQTFIKSVKLEDGTTIQKQLTSLIIVSPAGRSVTMSPPPSYHPVSEKVDYVSKNGNVDKMAYEKTLGKVSWKHRHIVLTGHKIDVFEKEKDSKPKEEVLINGWVKVAEKDSPKRKDAHSFSSSHGMMNMMTSNIGQMMADTDGIVGKEHCLEVHRLADSAQALDNLMNTSVVGLAFGGAKKIHSQPAVTYYFHFSSESERNEWLNAINNNLKAYLSSDEYLADVKKTFCTYLKNIGVNGESFDWRKILDELYM